MSTTDNTASIKRAILQVEKAVRTKIEPLGAGDTRDVTLDELVRAVPAALERDVVRVAMGELAARASHPVSIERHAGDTAAWEIVIAENVDA